MQSRFAYLSRYSKSVNIAIGAGFVLSWLLWYVPIYRAAMGRVAAEHGFALMHIVYVSVPVVAVVIVVLAIPLSRQLQNGTVAHLMVGAANMMLIAGVGMRYVAEHAAETNVPTSVENIMSAVNPAAPIISAGMLTSVGRLVLLAGLLAVIFNWTARKLNRQQRD